MRLIVPFAVPAAQAGRQALRALALPNLDAVLAAAPAARDDGDELSLSPPHERALAQVLGMSGPDGRLPWAAYCARALDGLSATDLGDLAWGLATPAHWHVGTDQVGMLDPARLGLDESDSRALCDAVRDLFAGADVALVWGAPLRWYVAHASLHGAVCASPDRVAGRNVDRWLEGEPSLFRRLQTEVQMRLYEHPLNAAREARGLPVMNSFWLSGCGPAQPAREVPGLIVDDRLRGPALAEDWTAFAAAWQALDAGPLADVLARWRRREPAVLTLCGESGAATWNARAGALRRLLRRASRTELEAL